MLDERWPSLDFGARWFAEHERARATAMLAKLAGWLRTSRSEYQMVAVEEAFRAEVGDAVITGRVDRLERAPNGRLVVVDLKTGKSKPADADLPTNPQLGAYQLAVESGAFGTDERSGGALLVQLGSHATVVEQRLGALDEAEDPDWIRTAVAGVAARLRGSAFDATENTACRNCDLKACCPLQPEGRQVVGP
jgi:RecB family exonuclease